MNPLIPFLLMVPTLGAAEETDALVYKVVHQREIMHQISVMISILEMYQLDPPNQALLTQLKEEREERKARIRQLFWRKKDVIERQIHELQRNPMSVKTKFQKSRLARKQNLAQLITQRLRQAETEGGNERLSDVLEAELEKLTLESESLRVELANEEVVKSASVESGGDVDRETRDRIESAELEELLDVTIKRHFLLMDLKDRPLKRSLHITPLGQPNGRH